MPTNAAKPPRSAPAPRPPQRVYLKALRQAELAAWNNSGGQIEALAPTSRRVWSELVRQARADAWLFTVAGCVAAITLIFTFRDSLDITQQFADFTRFLAHVLG